MVDEVVRRSGGELSRCVRRIIGSGCVVLGPGSVIRRGSGGEIGGGGLIGDRCGGCGPVVVAEDQRRGGEEPRGSARCEAGERVAVAASCPLDQLRVQGG